MFLPPFKHVRERERERERERLAKAENEAVRGSDGHEGNAIAVAADQGFQIGERQEDGGGVAVGMDAE